MRISDAYLLTLQQSDQVLKIAGHTGSRVLPLKSVLTPVKTQSSKIDSSG
jgi:hypothetical protein